MHANFLSPLKYMSAGVVGLESIDLGDRFLIFTATDDSSFSTFLVENDKE